MAEEDTALQLEEDEAAYEEALQADERKHGGSSNIAAPLGLVRPC